MAVIMSLFPHIWHWLLNFTGTNIPSTGSRWYNFWSGFGSDLGEIVIIGSIFTLYKHNNCAVGRCWRIGRHQVDGTPYKTCHKHATPTIHQQLQKKHKHDFPEQHELLNA
jgi:hypothetical protein